MYQDLRNEIEVMKALKHKHIISLIDVYESKYNLYIVMECCTGGELFDRIQSEGNLTEKTSARVMHQILEALEYMHSKKVAHCDLKPDNFLFTDNGKDAIIKVIDFGIAMEMVW